MPPVSRGFRGRRPRCRSRARAARSVRGDGLPGALRRPDAEDAARRVELHDQRRRGRAGVWSWEEFRRCRTRRSRVDIHCVTKWSKLDTIWSGISLDTLLERRRDRAASSSPRAATAATPRTFRSRTSPTARRGSPTSTTASRSTPEHGGPARLLVPHLYFWKSAKWVRGIELRDARRARLLGALRLPQLRRPLEGAALLGRLTMPAMSRARTGAVARSRRSRAPDGLAACRLGRHPRAEPPLRSPRRRSPGGTLRQSREPSPPRRR